MSASTATRRRRRRAGALIAATVLSGVLVLTPALSAQAAIWPTGFNPKQYMLNVLGSMLAGVSPDGKLGNAKRAIIQSDQQFDHSWEGLNELWKKDSPKNIPVSHEDYVLQRQKYFMDNGIKGIQGQKATETNTGKGTKYVKPMKAPATKAKKLLRAGVGIGVGVGSAYAWEHRADIGAAVGGLVGVDDTTGAYCTGRDQFGNAAAFTDFITGLDCDAWELDQAYDPNLDAVAREAGWKNYPIPWGCSNNDDLGTCYQVFTVKPQPKPVTGEQTFTVTAGTKKGQSVFINYFCLPATGKALGYASEELRWYQSSSSDDDKETQTIECKDGSKLYAWGLEPTNYATGSDPDGWLAKDDRHRFWYSDLSPNYIPGSTGDPSRSFICTYTMADGTTVEKESETFKETDDGNLPQPVCPAVDPADQDAVQSVAVDEVNKDNGTKQRIYEDDTTEQYRDWWGKYPECREGACALDLVQKSTNRSCFYSTSTAEACEDWMLDKNKADNYQCYYGGHKVDLQECYVYGDVFKPEKVLNGGAYTDPTTGEAVPGQSSPSAAKKVLERGITDPRDYRGCLDNGWAKANPVEWVMTPVMCALQWAFAPSPTTAIIAGNKVENAWNDKPPGRIASAASAWKFAPTASGCRLVVDLELPLPGGKEDHAPVGIDACDGPLVQYVGFVKVGLGIVLGVLSFMACRRVAAGFAGAESTVSSS